MAETVFHDVWKLLSIGKSGSTQAGLIRSAEEFWGLYNALSYPRQISDPRVGLFKEHIAPDHDCDSNKHGCCLTVSVASGQDTGIFESLSLYLVSNSSLYSDFMCGAMLFCSGKQITVQLWMSTRHETIRSHAMREFQKVIQRGKAGPSTDPAPDIFVEAQKMDYEPLLVDCHGKEITALDLEDLSNNGKKKNVTKKKKKRRKSDKVAVTNHYKVYDLAFLAGLRTIIDSPGASDVKSGSELKVVQQKNGKSSPGNQKQRATAQRSKMKRSMTVPNMSRADRSQKVHSSRAQEEDGLKIPQRRHSYILARPSKANKSDIYENSDMDSDILKALFDGHQGYNIFVLDKERLTRRMWRAIHADGCFQCLRQDQHLPLMTSEQQGVETGPYVVLRCITLRCFHLAHLRCVLQALSHGPATPRLGRYHFTTFLMSALACRPAPVLKHEPLLDAHLFSLELVLTHFVSNVQVLRLNMPTPTRPLLDPKTKVAYLLWLTSAGDTRPKPIGMERLNASPSIAGRQADWAAHAADTFLYAKGGGALERKDSLESDPVQLGAAAERNPEDAPLPQQGKQAFGGESYAKDGSDKQEHVFLRSATLSGTADEFEPLVPALMHEPATKSWAVTRGRLRLRCTNRQTTQVWEHNVNFDLSPLVRKNADVEALEEESSDNAASSVQPTQPLVLRLMHLDPVTKHGFTLEIESRGGRFSVVSVRYQIPNLLDKAPYSQYKPLAMPRAPDSLPQQPPVKKQSVNDVSTESVTVFAIPNRIPLGPNEFSYRYSVSPHTAESSFLDVGTLPQTVYPKPHSPSQLDSDKHFSPTLNTHFPMSTYASVTMSTFSSSALQHTPSKVLFERGAAMGMLPSPTTFGEGSRGDSSSDEMEPYLPPNEEGAYPTGQSGTRLGQDNRLGQDRMDNRLGQDRLGQDNRLSQDRLGQDRLDKRLGQDSRLGEDPDAQEQAYPAAPSPRAVSDKLPTRNNHDDHDVDDNDDFMHGSKSSVRSEDRTSTEEDNAVDHKYLDNAVFSQKQSDYSPSPSEMGMQSSKSSSSLSRPMASSPSSASASTVASFPSAASVSNSRQQPLGFNSAYYDQADRHRDRDKSDSSSQSFPSNPFPRGSSKSPVVSSLEEQPLRASFPPPALGAAGTGLPSGLRGTESAEQVRGHVVALATAHSGSRFVQQKLDSGDREFFEVFFQEMKLHIAELMVDNFGHFAVEKLIALCGPEKNLELVERVAPDAAHVVCHRHGSFCIQALIGNIFVSSRGAAQYEAIVQKQIDTLVLALESRFLRIVTNASGHFVVMRMLQKFSAASMKRLDETIASHCLHVCMDHNGLRVVKVLLATRQVDEILPVIQTISESTLPLVEDEYGNYVIQSVLDICSSGRGGWKLNQVADNIKSKMVGRFMELSKQKFSSNVVEMCLKQSDEHWRNTITQELIKQPGVSRLLRDRFGNYVLQTAISLAAPSRVHEIAQNISPHLVTLRENIRQKWKKILKRALQRATRLDGAAVSFEMLGGQDETRSWGAGGIGGGGAGGSGVSVSGNSPSVGSVSYNKQGTNESVARDRRKQLGDGRGLGGMGQHTSMTSGMGPRGGDGLPRGGGSSADGMVGVIGGGAGARGVGAGLGRGGGVGLCPSMGGVGRAVGGMDGGAASYGGLVQTGAGGLMVNKDLMNTGGGHSNLDPRHPPHHGFVAHPAQNVANGRARSEYDDYF